MAKTATNGTLSPAVFNLGNVIYAEDVQAALEQQNFAVTEHTQRFHFSKKPIPFVASEVILRGHLWVPAWVNQITVLIETSGGGTFAPTLTLGSTSQAFTPNVADTRTLLTSATGTGFLGWSLAGLLTAGDGQLDVLRVRTGPVAATNIPDPIDE
ncbi:MAG: hypothetical protein AAGJ19_13745 [Myxococcota bacterium]